MQKKTITYKQFMEVRQNNDWREIGIDNFMCMCTNTKKNSGKVNIKDLIKISLVGLTGSAAVSLIYFVAESNKSIYAF